MENLKENLKKIYDLKKENKKIEEDIKLLENNSIEIYHKGHDEFIQHNNIINNNKMKINLNNLKISILKNNIHYLFKMDLEGIKPKLLDYYENKKIGEKTKEKIKNEIEEYFKNNYNIKIGCYLQIESDSFSYIMKISLDFLNDDGYKDFTFGYDEQFEIEFAKHSYNNFETSINYHNNINEYIEIKDINKEANKLLKDYNKTVEKIEKLRLQQKELYHSFVDNLHGFVYNNLKIKTDLRIY